MTPLTPYLDVLRALPFVRRVSVRAGERTLVLHTPTTRHPLAVETKRSHLTREAVEAVIARVRPGEPTLLVAPLIGAALGDMLASAHVNFVDRDGNCFLNLDDRYVARVQKAARQVKAAPATGIRAAGYQVLIALLADDALMNATVRALAEAAGVSTAPAHQMRARLVEQGLAVKTKSGYAWVPARKRDAIDLVATGYATTLRPRLVIGRYRTREFDPPRCEADLAKAFGKATWAFGGGSAAAALTGHYHGPFVTVHADDPSSVLQAMRAVPDREGPLVVLKSAGPASLRGPKPHLAHPLVVYAELLVEGGERAREAAREVLDAWVVR